MTTTYEWAVEQTDENGDVLDMQFFETFAEAAAFQFDEHETVICLVRDVGDNVRGLVDRSWAYVKDGKLPERFCYCAGSDDDGPQVPKRFHAEVSKANS